MSNSGEIGFGRDLVNVVVLCVDPLVRKLDSKSILAVLKISN